MAYFPVAQISKKLLAATAIAALCTASAMAGAAGLSDPCPLIPIVHSPYYSPISEREQQQADRSAALAFQAECQRQQKIGRAHV